MQVCRTATNGMAGVQVNKSVEALYPGARHKRGPVYSDTVELIRPVSSTAKTLHSSETCWVLYVHSEQWHR